VSHHPPISACYAEGNNYEFWMNTSMKTTFWGKSLEVKPLGFQHVRIRFGDLKSTEHYVIERPNSSVNNLIFGEMYVEHFGPMFIKNMQTGDICNVEFKKRGWSGKGAYEVEGFTYNKSNPKDKKGRIWGKWTESLSIQVPGSSEEKVIWKAHPLPP